jgi:hypothetical protein
MKTKIMGTLAILLIGLSVAGIVYAHWVDTATIKVNVTMGSLTFGFTRILAEWDAEDYEGYAAKKRSASTVCTMSDLVTDVHTGYSVNKTLTFSMVNATPEYWGINKFTLDNVGTIPVKIQGITLTLPAGLNYIETQPNLVWDVYNVTTGDHYYYIWLYNETAEIDAARVTYPLAPPWVLSSHGVNIVSIIGTQIDKLGSVPVEMCVYIPETAQECHTYTFSMEIEAIQWNKYIAP